MIKTKNATRACFGNMKNIRLSKRSQFKIQQMTFMLIAVVFFFVLVGLFWIGFQYSGLKKNVNQLNEDRTSQIVSYLSSQSEFSCGEDYCIDTDKLLMLNERSVYSEFWPVSYIKVRALDGENETSCNKANYPKCNVYDVYENPEIESKSSMGSFVALCRHETLEEYPIQICKLGRITIGYELK